MIDFHTHPVLIQEFADKFPNYQRVGREVLRSRSPLRRRADGK
jgi:hypothetical protein